jgi:hypothetical protein
MRIEALPVGSIWGEGSGGNYCCGDIDLKHGAGISRLDRRRERGG